MANWLRLIATDRDASPTTTQRRGLRLEIKDLSVATMRAVCLSAGGLCRRLRVWSCVSRVHSLHKASAAAAAARPGP